VTHLPKDQLIEQAAMAGSEASKFFAIAKECASAGLSGLYNDVANRWIDLGLALRRLASMTPKEKK
jgi:hypothetical protein